MTRILFGQPVPGTVDIAAILVILSVFLALAEAERVRAHVRMEIFVGNLPSRLASYCRALSMLLGAGILSFMIYACWLRATQSWRSGEILSDILPIVVWPFRYLIAGGFALFLLVCLAKAVAYLAAPNREQSSDSTIPF